MDVLISASNAFCRYLKVELDRLPSPDGKRIGTQPVQTTGDCMAWQCHAVKRKTSRGEMTDFLAVEARSRYVLLFSNPGFQSLKEFFSCFRKRWAEESVHMAIESGAVSKDQANDMFEQFLDTPMRTMFCRNTDLSINGHVGDAQQWLLQSYEHYGIDVLEKDVEFGLGRQINKLRKKAKPFPGARRQESFLPMSRMVDDWLYRFARGLSKWPYPNTKDGDFPDPYWFEDLERNGKFAPTVDELMAETVPEVPDNVVNLADARKKRAQA